MKISYDPQSDVLRILFTNAPIDRSRTALPGMVFDYDDRDSIVALEVQEASQRIHDPRVLEHSDQCVARCINGDDRPSAR